jgi:hypothetical protein
MDQDDRALLGRIQSGSVESFGFLCDRTPRRSRRVDDLELPASQEMVRATTTR